MKKLIKFTTLLVVSLFITGQANAKSVSEKISHAPAIDASYSQVQADVAQHLGTNVRWGGQVIGSEKIDKLTRVTVLAYPLDSEGKPAVNQSPLGDAFVVDFEKNSCPSDLALGNYITVYGRVDSDIKLINGPLETQVPLVVSQEVERWSERSITGINTARNSLAFDRLYYDSLAFSGSSRFGFTNSRFGFSSSRFGFSNSRFGLSRFGNRSFSTFGRFGRY